MATEHEYTQLPTGASTGSPARSSPQWLLLRIPLALICGAVADMVDADLPDHDWPANTLTLLSSEVVGRRRQPLSARADGAGGLWIAARGELVRWTSSGISERHLAARTAWMVDGRVTHAFEQNGQLRKRHFRVLLFREGVLDQRSQIRDRGVPFERGKNRLNLRDLQGELVEIIEVSVEKTMLLEKFSRPRDVDIADEIGAPFQRLLECRRGVSREFGRFSVDHDEDDVFDIRKATREGQVVLARLKMFGDE